MNEWPAAIWASISAMTAALVLTLIFNLGSVTRLAAHIQQEDETAIAILKEYRKYDQFMGAVGLLPQDVVSAIAESRGIPEVWVDIEPSPGNGGANVNFAWKWTQNTDSEEFNIDKLLDRFSADAIPPTARYDSAIVKNPIGEIIRIEFRRQDG